MITDGVAYLAAIALSVVFAYSAIMKLRDPRATRRVLDKAGVPGVSAITRALPVLELAVAIALLVRPSLGAIAAIALLVPFTLFVVYLLARGIEVSCGCFGANASESVSEVDVVRNIMLLVLALIATTVMQPSSIRLEELILATTATATSLVLLSAMSTRHKLGQFFDNRLPGER